MIRIKDRKQQHLFDPWDFLSPKRRQMLDRGWPGLFREHLLNELPVARLAASFHDSFGRPTKELHTVLGVLLLQQTMDLSDMDAIEQLAFNIQWHYALDIPEESDAAKTISEKTLWNMRRLVAENNLDDAMFESLTGKLAEVFDVDTSNQRIDSVHIQSNMRRLGRIGIFSRTIVKFLVNLKRHHRDRFDEIEKEIVERYWGKKAAAFFSRVKPTASAKTLEMVSNDLFDLVERFKDVADVYSMYSYKLMQRVLTDQCNLEPAEDGSKVTVKPPREIDSGSLQNPSDPDATYSGHKGQGYQTQIMETYSRSEDEEEKEQTLNLITHVEVQTACESDAHALVPAIADTQIRGLGPDEVLADTLYGSDDNHRVAAVANVNLVAPTSKGSLKKPLTEFRFDDEGHVIACPAGHAPQKCKLKKRKYSAVFDLDGCRTCPRLSKCPVKLERKKAVVRYTAKQQRLAARRAYEQTDPFAEVYRYRAGVEATMSEYDRRTGVKKLRVRGMKAVRLCAKLKAAGLNMLRAARVKVAREKARRANPGANQRAFSTFSVVKERSRGTLVNFGIFFRSQFKDDPAIYKMAA